METRTPNQYQPFAFFAVHIPPRCVRLGKGFTYQSLHGPVQRMPMVPPELGIRAFEGRVAVRFGFFDANCYQRGIKGAVLALFDAAEVGKMSF